MAWATAWPAGAFAARSTPALQWRAERLRLPCAWEQLHADADGGWLGVDALGRLWRAGGKAGARQLADGLDHVTPLAIGHGQVAARRADGRLWVGASAAEAGASDLRLSPRAGLLILPLGVIGVAEATGASTANQLVRLEPGGRGGAWQTTARSAEPVLPDARPIQVDLERRGDGGHVAVLGGPDRSRYPHGVLGDDVEATRVLWLERHDLSVMRSLDVPAPQVIEDIAPRVWARAGDPPALLTVRSGPRGGQLVLIDTDPSDPRGLRVAAAGAPLGTRMRWLSPSTDGATILAVHTPHIGGVLHRYRRVERELVAERWDASVSNHAIGSRELDVSAWLQGHFVVSDQPRRALRAFDVRSGTLAGELELPEPARRIVSARDGAALACLLQSGALFVVTPGR